LFLDVLVSCVYIAVGMVWTLLLLLRLFQSKLISTLDEVRPRSCATRGVGVKPANAPHMGFAAIAVGKSKKAWEKPVFIFSESGALYLRTMVRPQEH